ncbi:MAG: ABC transporter ATP-binding protein [Acidimicrobiales bacterium]
MSAPTLAVRGVVHRYGATLALDVEDLVIGPGTTALLGPNGSGKSTLLRLLATVRAPQAGSVRIGGLDPTDPVARVSVRRRLGYQTQSGGLPGRMRVDAFCDYVGALKEIPTARLRRRWTHWVLQRVALAEASRRRIRTLSGGMQRRLALAQALIGLPRLLVLDEPLASLDAEQRAAMAFLLADRSPEATIVVASHHPDELAGVAGQMVVLREGRVVFAGPPTSLAEQARGRVWETSTPVPGAACRTVGPDRVRCVAPGLPPAAVPMAPTVQDGYLAVLQRDPWRG